MGSSLGSTTGSADPELAGVGAAPLDDGVAAGVLKGAADDQPAVASTTAIAMAGQAIRRAERSLRAE